MAIRKMRGAFSWGVAGLLLGLHQPAVAQTHSDDVALSAGGLEEITVTATRRETNAQEVPIAVTAISGTSLRESGIVNPSELSSLAPNLHVDQGVHFGQTHVSIRGIASSDFSVAGSPPVATVIDDIYQPFQFGNATQAFDLNRIEVLRGPQGTLLGKNTTSGALNYYSQTPKFDREGYLSIGVGSGDFDQYSLEGVYNAPLTDTLAARASIRVDERDDYVDNLFDGSELGGFTNMSGRLQFGWKSAAGTTVNLKLYGNDFDGDGPIYVAKYRVDPCSRGGYPASYFCGSRLGMPTPDARDSRTVASEKPTFEKFHSYGAVLRIDQAIGDGTFTSISGYQEGENELAENSDGVAGDAFFGYRMSDVTLYSQEMRYATSEDDRLRAVVGVFAQYDEILANNSFTSTQVDSATNGISGFDNFAGSLGEQETTSLAGFGSLTFDVTERFSLVGGLRYSYEKKDVSVLYREVNGAGGPPTFALRNPPLDLGPQDYTWPRINALFPVVDSLLDRFESYVADESWSKLTWDATANFRPAEDALIYARVASGFRSGGYSVNISAPGTFRELEPETVLAYEVGLKSEWLNNTLRLNGAIFWTDYDDMQVVKINPSGRGSIRENAASSRVKGAEVEMEYAATDALLLFGSVGYSDAKFREYDTGSIGRGIDGQGRVNGYNLPYAPSWSSALGAEYTLPLGANNLRLATNWTYRSEVFFSAFEDPLERDNSQLIGNARASYGSASKGWRVTAYVKNLTDREIKVYQYSFGNELIAPAIYGPLRTWGVEISFDF